MKSEKRQGVRRITGLIMLLAFPVIMNWFSPYLSIWAASEGIIAGSVLTFGALLITSVVMGRAFCGWLCPLGALMDIARPANNRRISNTSWVKYLVWFPWISILALNLVRGWKGWLVSPLFQIESGVSVSEPQHYMMFAMVLGVVLILSLSIGRRAACHTICWISPFMIVGRWIGNTIHVPALHLRSRPEQCISCKRCVKACPMSLDVNRMVTEGKMDHRECALCGECADTCPRDAIGFRFGPPM